MQAVVKYFERISENSRIALTGVSAVAIVLLFEGRPVHITVNSQPAVAVEQTVDEQEPPMVDPALDHALQEKTIASVSKLDPLLNTLMRNGAYGAVKNRLLNLASAAVADQELDRLSQILLLLGQVSIEEQNLGAAEVYLFEALDVVASGGNEPARAEIYMQLGRTYLKSREVARDAGYAYDALQIARNQLSKRQYHRAEQNIRYAIEQSLSINRYNAAASAYQTLNTLYLTIGDRYQAEESLLEAIRLYSSSGQTRISTALLAELRAGDIEPWRLLDVENQIEANRKTYEESITQIGIARDYQRLYNYYLNQGNVGRAWHFRLLASRSLEEVSKRAMFHRQQGVLALLYNSNDAMANAKHYFSEARERFSSQGNKERVTQTAALDKGVY